MRDLTTYALRCMENLDAIGVSYGNVLDFTVNTRAKNRWGQCRAVPGGFTININAVLLDERNPEESLLNTIIHELLHTCKNCMNHGREWKTLAEKVNRAYHLNVSRTASADQKGIVAETLPEKTVKHRFVCEDCGQIVERQRESDFTKRYNLYTCGRCHGHFKKEF